MSDIVLNELIERGCPSTSTWVASLRFPSMFPLLRSTVTLETRPSLSKRVKVEKLISRRFDPLEVN